MSAEASVARFAIDLVAFEVVAASLYFVARQKPTGHPYAKSLLMGFHVIFEGVILLEMVRTFDSSPGFLDAYAVLTPTLVLWDVALLGFLAYSIHVKPAGTGLLSVTKSAYMRIPHGPILATFFGAIIGTDVYLIAYRPYTIVTLTTFFGSTTRYPAAGAAFSDFTLAVLLFFAYPTVLLVQEARRTKERGARNALIVLPLCWGGIGAILLFFHEYLVTLGYDFLGVGYVMISALFGLTAMIFRRTSLLSAFFEPIPAEKRVALRPEDTRPLDVFAPILLMVDPGTSFEKALAAVARGKTSAGSLVYVFTSKGSPLHYGLSEVPEVRFYLLSTNVSYITPSDKSNELLVPQGDTSVMLDLLDKTVSTARRAAITIIFDSISDLVLYLGAEATYKFLKQAQQILVPPNLTSIYLLVVGAQDEKTLNLVRSLFRIHAALDQSGLRVTKGEERIAEQMSPKDQP